MEGVMPQATKTHVTTSGNLLAGGNSEGFRSAGSAELHCGGCGANLAHHGVTPVFHPVHSMNVLPAAWQHQVGHSAEQSVAGPVGLSQ